MSRPRVVFAGAGHASLIALDRLAGRIDADLTLVSEGASAPYSGMVPGFIEGVYGRGDMEIPLPQFCARRGVRFVDATVTAADGRTVTLARSAKAHGKAADGQQDGEGSERLEHDILVLDTGAVAALPPPLASPLVVPAKPFAALIEGLSARLLTAAAFAVVGGGPGGVEVAFALRRRRPDAAVTLVERADTILAAFPAALRRRVGRRLAEARIAVECGAEVAAVSQTRVRLADARAVESACTVAFTGAAPPPLLDALPFARAGDGFVAVDATMRSLSHRNVLAAGDVATNEADPRPKAGVFAVRSGPPLARAVAALVKGRTPPTVRLQRRALVLLSTGGGRAIGVRNGIVAEGRWVFRLKDHLDRAFVKHLTA